MIFSKLRNVFSSGKIDDDFFEELEEILVMGDVGINATTQIIYNLKEVIQSEKINDPTLCKEKLISIIKELLRNDKDIYEFEKRKSIVFLVGVNGAGKTTTIGKLAVNYKNEGKNIIIAALDTFRAGASEQLSIWADRAQTSIVKNVEGSDPGAVLFDAIESANSKNADIILCDTAGRLQNKKNLMSELTKLKNIADKNAVDYKIEVLLVLDGTTGQNALSQAKEFKESVGNIDGVVITKLDGSSKGGIGIAIQMDLDIPIKYIGVGERIEDLKRFDENEYVDSLFKEE